MEKEQFESLSKDIADMKKDLDEVKGDVKKILINDLPHILVELATLKVKAGIWGAIAGALPATIISVIAFLIMLSQFGK
ncbi:MAG TPA: hypothetical protein ENI23_08320 [bacterium]|nr:hypothetical protein [bacterium]